MPNWVHQKLIVLSPTNPSTLVEEEFIRTKLLTEQGDFDFNKIVPAPAELAIESSVWNVPCIRLYATRMIANGFDSHEESAEFMKHLKVVADYFDRSPASLLIPAGEEETFIEQNNLNDDIAAHIDFGKICFNNIVKYGFMTMIDFNCAMWGTKWNAHETFTDRNEVYYQTADRAAIEVIDALAEQYPEFIFTLYYIGEDVERSSCGKYLWRDGRLVEQEFYEAGSNSAYEVAFDLGVECREDYDFDSRGYHRRELDF